MIDEKKQENGQEDISTSMLSIADYDLESTLQAAEKNVEKVKAMKRIALSVTNRHDWVDQQGKPYLQSSGCEKIRPLFNISWEVVESRRENEENGHFSYITEGFFTMSGQRISVIGARSTKDPFFKRYEKDNKGSFKVDECGNKIEQPKSNIDATDVRKAAYSNFVMQGITRILGIRNLTYEELEGYTGITSAIITSIKYGGSSASKNYSSNSGSNGAPTEKQVGFLRKLLADAGFKGKEAEGINGSKVLEKEIASAADLTGKEASALIEYFKGLDK